MKIHILNAKEAENCLEDWAGEIQGELMFNQLMKQPEQVRVALYKMLIQEYEENTDEKE